MTVFVIMGVSGSGKTSVGQRLAKRLDCSFYDGDDFHPPENIAKMGSGIPLNDEDRYPWLGRLHELIAEHLARGETAVIACSALKKSYRDQLQENNEAVQFVYLQGSFDLIWQRMASRENHYMKAEMLQSQFLALEEPTSKEAYIVGIGLSIEEIVDCLMTQ